MLIDDEYKRISPWFRFLSWNSHLLARIWEEYTHCKADEELAKVLFAAKEAFDRYKDEEQNGHLQPFEKELLDNTFPPYELLSMEDVARFLIALSVEFVDKTHLHGILCLAIEEFKLALPECDFDHFDPVIELPLLPSFSEDVANLWEDYRYYNVYKNEALSAALLTAWKEMIQIQMKMDMDSFDY